MLLGWQLTLVQCSLATSFLDHHQLLVCGKPYVWVSTAIGGECWETRSEGPGSHWCQLLHPLVALQLMSSLHALTPLLWPGLDIPCLFQWFWDWQLTPGRVLKVSASRLRDSELTKPYDWHLEARSGAAPCQISRKVLHQMPLWRCSTGLWPYESSNFIFYIFCHSPLCLLDQKHSHLYKNLCSISLSV